MASAHVRIGKERREEDKNQYKSRAPFYCAERVN